MGRKRVLKCGAVPKHSPGSELGRAAHIKSQPSAARSAIGSHRCSLGGPQCPDEVNMSGSGSPLTSGPRDEGRRAGGGGGGYRRLCELLYSHGDVLFMNGSRVNRPTLSSKEVAARAEQLFLR